MDSGAAFTGADTGDTFNATHLTLTALDSLDGGAGADTLNVIDTGTTAAATFANTTIKNIETLNLTSVTGLNGGALDTSTGFTGLTAANVVLTAPGANQSLTVGSSTAAVLSVTTQAARNLTVLGGTSVDVTAGLVTTGEIAVGSTLAAPTGAVTVKSTGDYADADVTLGAISVTGGTTVSVTQSAGITAAEVAAAATDTTNKTVTQSAVTVTGTATTTSVSVTQSAAQAVTAGSVAEDGVIGIANGSVTVNDVNRTSTTKAGTISSVTLDSYGAATVNSGALTSLTLKGTGTSVDASTLGALATAANTALALNVAGLTNTGAITVDADIKTINLDGQVKASSLGTLAAAGMTALNISGSQKVTITSLNAAQLTAITSTSTGDVTISSALGTGVAYTGAAGKDTITLGATTKAITTGAGDDAVTVTAAFGTGGSVDAGEGTDTLALGASVANSLSADATFEGTVTGFERASIGADGGVAFTANMNNLDDINYVTLSDANTASNTISNIDTGFTLVLSNANSSTTVQLENDSTGDVFNLTASRTTGTAFGTVAAANFETVNLTASGVNATTGAAVSHTLTLTDAALKTLNVSGTANLTLTFTGTKLTTLDASAKTSGTFSLTTGALEAASSFTGSAKADTINAALAAAAVTINAGAGDDVITGSADKASTLNGGDGKDSITGGAAADTVNGGDGVDTFTFSSTNVVEQDGSGATSGTVINLSADALSQSTVYNKTVELLGAGNGLYLSAAGATVAAGTTAYLFNNESTTNAVVNDTLASIENVNGTNLADLIIGSTGNNALVGGGGADYIEGGAGDDYLDGSAGNSIDKLFGGTGNDTYAVTDAGEVDIIVEAATGGTDTLLFTGDLSLAGVAFGATLAGAVGDASLANIEQVVLAADADAVFTATQVSGLSLLIGEAAAGTSSITVNGAASAQTIDLSGFKFATAGYSYTNNAGALTTMSDLTSGTDLIRINGGAAADTIKGTSYADVINGGAGADVIDGGAGADLISFGNVLIAGDTAGDAGDLAGSLASDTITFVAADDKFLLSETIFGTMGNGVSGAGAALNAAQFKSIAGTSGSLAALSIDNTGNGAIVYDTTNNDLYFIEAGVDLTAAATDTLGELVGLGNAIKIADVTLTGVLAAANFAVIA